MALKLNYINETSYKINQNVVRGILEKTLAEQEIDFQVEINVQVINEETMADLHKRFMKTQEATDVLSFPLWEKSEIKSGRGVDPDGIVRLGDIVICAQVAERQGEEIDFLAQHGCLHLLGIHHET